MQTELLEKENDMKSERINRSRREFLAKSIPTCALTCLAVGKGFASPLTIWETSSQKKTHPFEALVKDVNYRQYYAAIFNDVIFLARGLADEWGKDKTLTFLKKMTTKMMSEYGQRQASRSPDNSFKTWGSTFRNMATWKTRMVHEIAEDTDKVFELKVKECVFADIFKASDATDYGYAFICYGDYAWPRAFNPKISMVRDKTLMQGHDCCNHRYIWEE